jgi:hypothetical protein
MVDRIRWKEGVSVRNILSHKVRIGRYYTEIRLSILSATLYLPTMNFRNQEPTLPA